MVNKEINDVLQSVIVIRNFLETHAVRYRTGVLESDIDGEVLITDWGYFDEGLNLLEKYMHK